jgi:hypothetical protein
METIAEPTLADVVRPRAAARLRKFRREVEARFPGRVVDVILFGSRARGDARADSDYDVAVLIEDLEDRRMARHALSDITYPYMLTGFHIQALAFPETYLTIEQPGMLARNIARDGISVTR